MRRRQNGRYAVTGPGVYVSYADVGPALSRSQTAASAATEDGTWYVRDVDGTVLGYSERTEGVIVTVQH